MVNGLRGTAHLFAWQVQHLVHRMLLLHAFAWQVQHLESLGAACGQRSPRDRAPFCVASAALGAPDAAFCVAGAALREPGRTLWSTVSAGPAHSFAWQVQHLESLGAACGQRSPRDRAPFCVAGAALGAPDAALAWQVQH